jgi:hypothetical protein
MDDTMRTPMYAAATALCLLAVLAPRGSAQSRLPASPPSAPAGPPNSLVETDRDGDGKNDFRVIYDARGRAAEEDMDFNFDGIYDTFYYYTAGVLQRVEIDSKGAGKIDIRVTLMDGTYVKRTERDADGDGKFEIVKDYGGGQ